MRITLAAIAALICVLIQSAAFARNIVVTNDDGLTSNVVALYRALKKQGHDVIVSVPCANQSGMGAAIYIGRPLGPLKQSCLNGAAEAGAPGAGPMTRNGFDKGDFYYVDGTPVMALLYGVDIIARKRWDDGPDLVLSGPNEGQNVGAVILNSGTVSNAQYAAVRGIPAIALSAGANTKDDEALANPNSKAVALRAAELVRALEKNAGKKGALLPKGIALNVNFPDDVTEAEWRLTKIGTYNAYNIDFAESMKQDGSPMLQQMAQAHGGELPDLPGVSIERNEAAPNADQENDESIVYRRAIAVSPMQAGYEQEAFAVKWLEWRLSALFSADRE